MESIKNYLVLILTIIIIVLLLLKGCNNPLPNLDNKPLTIYKSDTIFSLDTVVKFKTIIRPKYVNIYKLDTIKENIDLDTLFYVREYNDSLVNNDITIYHKNRVIGILDNSSISYKLHSKPILITNTIETTKIEYKQPNTSIYTGMSLIGNKSSFDVAPYINLNLKNKNIIYSYHILENRHQIGLGIKLFNSKK